jgi:hypothetical protein
MPAERPKTSRYRTETDARRDGVVSIERERTVAALAKRQHGVISLAQLRRLGLTSSGVRNRVACGRMTPVHEGVYATGHAPLSQTGRWMAAVLACGPGSALCGRSAGALHGLIKERAVIEVVAPGRRGKARPGVTVRERTLLEPRDRTAVDGIPCTSVARTLLDLAATLWPDELVRACERAEELRLFDLRAIDDVVERNRGRRGVRRLRIAVDSMRPAEPAVRSELERLFLRLCEREGLPRPHVNAWIELPGGGLEVDFSWPAARLVVEVDGAAYHSDTVAFERDRERDRQLLLAGWRVMRVTWRQLTLQPADLGSALRALLADDGLSPGRPASRGRSGSRGAPGAGSTRGQGGGGRASSGR